MDKYYAWALLLTNMVLVFYWGWALARADTTGIRVLFVAMGCVAAAGAVYAALSIKHRAKAEVYKEWREWIKEQ